MVKIQGMLSKRITTSSCRVVVLPLIRLFLRIVQERSIRKWVLWILFYNIKFKSIDLPKY